MHFGSMKSLHFFLSTLYRLKLCRVGLRATAGLSQLCQQTTLITVASRISSPCRKGYRWSLQKSPCLFGKKCFTQKEHTVVQGERSVSIAFLPPWAEVVRENMERNWVSISTCLTLSKSWLILMPGQINTRSKSPKVYKKTWLTTNTCVHNHSYLQLCSHLLYLPH